jgi:acetylornithine deacetylase
VNDLERSVSDAIAAGRDELVGLVADLVGFDTTAREPTDPPRQEANLQRYLADRLAAAGASIDLWEPETGSLGSPRQVPPGLAFAGRPQLAATFAGAGGGRSLLLNGHIDAVTPDPIDAWTSDPWKAEERDGNLYGVGASDMKSGVACMAYAAEVLARLGVRLEGDLIIHTNTDEESSGAGSIAGVQHGLRADAGICTEPTPGEIWVACRGSMSLTVTVPGRAGHAEIEHPHWREGGAVNAIDKASILMDAVRELDAEWQARPDRTHPYLPPATIMTTVINGGTWYVIYPAACTFTVNMLYLPADADAEGWGSEMARQVEERLLAAAATDDWLAENPPSFEWGPDLPPFEVDEASPIVETLAAAATDLGPPQPLGGLASWFDAASFTRAGACPMVGFGAGTAGRPFEGHSADESIVIDDLVRCAQTLAVTAMRWCGVAGGTRLGPVVDVKNGGWQCAHPGE